ncbi:tripartite tricarboxylate transporter TctB family protein [Helicobacter sp.]|uniref:tripartite tricarboxylate transporter TctB family protein n=1 Tax=Helicobacter sp. TaxID=218 RepID=UPI0025BADFF4|nr:tripartite tricarboxylate transporter TctB family protein [Helicobacter sp.]MCI5968474.1 tripartite tricarboxylate transporter TctB family protein [Helicobacter sp.]MDY2585259.1 tripartite tricarboxylate transporter TctB family protein [Helicobacter sp.]
MLSTRVFSAFLFFLSIFLFYNALGISTEYSYEPLGPRPFPLISLFLIIVCAILLYFFAEDTKASWGQTSLWKKICILLAAMFIFAGIFEYFGFIIATIFLVFIMAILFGAKIIQSFILAIFCGFAFYYVFENLLQITLPFGLIFQ